MARVLVVDDEKGFRDNLLFALKGEGHTVEIASDGRQAIDIGAQFLPEVLIADWMLKSNMHGLQVADALRALVPDMRTILITGFGSEDLRHEADISRVDRFIEKPFSFDEIRVVVSHSGDTGSINREFSLIGIVSTEPDGRVRIMNGRARAVLGIPTGDLGELNFADLVNNPSGVLTRAQASWIEVPLKNGETSCRMRARALAGGSHVLVIAEQREQFVEYHSLTRMVLDLGGERENSWHMSGNAILMDPLAESRRVSARTLRDIGCPCHGVSSPSDVLRLFHQDPDVSVVILMLDSAPKLSDGSEVFLEYSSQPPSIDPDELADMVAHLRSIRSDIMIVGSSMADRREEFAHVGFDSVIREPWGIDELINAISGRLGHCRDCGAFLPLRTARKGEPISIWECCACRARYEGVLDSTVPAALQENVTPRRTTRA